MGKTLLLVDDEPLVLRGLQRSLRSMQDEWSFQCAASGAEALEVLAKRPCDVIVTDMRMPGMDGAQLLNEVRRRSPHTVRVALSGQCDRETVMSAIGSTHQYISKPCDAKMLKDTINHAIALRNELQTHSVTRVVSQLKTIPSLPASYRSMMEELSMEQPRLDKLATLVAADMGMAAKCLQLVNSAFSDCAPRSRAHSMRSTCSASTCSSPWCFPPMSLRSSPPASSKQARSPGYGNTASR